jgi:parallel beta-helix repeat protein
MIKRESKTSGLSLKWVAAVVLAVVFADSALATKHTPGDTSIGTWDPINRIYTLNTDVYETEGNAIEIDEDDLILDGDGHSVKGAGLGYGVYLRYGTGITIKNLNVQGFSSGIYLYNSSNNMLTTNTCN